MPVIELNSVSKWYGEVIGLNNLTVSISEGMTALVGPNGAGKSTLMGLIMGQLKPSKGNITVLGQCPWNNPKVLSQIGYCPEGDPFWMNVTGKYFVRFLAGLSGLKGRTATLAVEEAIERTAMTEAMDRPIGTYSKGMRQRIKIAQALVHKPKLLILDEPFTGADPVARHELVTLFRELAQSIHILVSSHVLHEVEAMTQHILMIAGGRLVAKGDLHDLRQQMHHRPHTIRIRLDRPREIASQLSHMEEVSGLRMLAADTLLVETITPDKVYDRIFALLHDSKINVREIAPADDNLEAVFGYLTE